MNIKVAAFTVSEKASNTTAVVVSVWSLKNFSPCIDIVLIFFFSYSGPSGISGSDGKQNTA